MRQLFVAAVVVLILGAVHARAEERVDFKGPHICCKQCVAAVAAILKDVEGITDAKCDIKEKTVSFTAKDQKAAEAAVAGLYKGGFAGEGKYGDAKLGGKVAKKTDGKVDSVTVKNVHACCGQCNKALKALFPDAQVTIEGTGPKKDVTVTGTGLNIGEVIAALRKAGFNGQADKK
jgi:periplasmic mercuric ion binding protein